MNDVTGRRAAGHVSGPPTTDGVYAVEVYFGWKLLEFKEGEWWHLSCIGRWTACAPLQWVGPLPPLKGQKPALEFDL